MRLKTVCTQIRLSPVYNKVGKQGDILYMQAFGESQSKGGMLRYVSYKFANLPIFFLRTNLPIL